MAVSPLEAHELSLTPQSANRGLARRLMDGTLRPPEQQYLDKVERIAAFEAEGKYVPEIAEVLGEDADKLRGWMRTEKYRLFRKFVADRALLRSDGEAHDRRRAERRRWDSNGAKALDYYDQAFRRHPKDVKAKGIKKGDFVDLDRAERAAKLFAESAGWTEPVPTQQKPRDLKVGVIQQRMQGIAAADAKETVVRVTVGDTTIEVGSRETNSLGVG